MEKKIQSKNLTDVDLSKITGGSDLTQGTLNDLSSSIVCFKGGQATSKNIIKNWWYKHLGKH